MSRKKIWEKKKRFPKENRASFKKKNIKSLKKQGLLAEGVFIGNARGFGFVETGEDEEDIFIPADAVNTALHQDKVQVLLKKEQKPGKRREGTVIKILERGTTEVVGTFQREGDYGFVLCDNQKISRDVYISPKNSHGIRDGEKVVAQILDYGSEKRKPEGKITESLGNIHAPGADILAVVKSYGIPSEFPVRVMNQAMRVPDHVLEADWDGRDDLTGLMTVTIDGEDAKDLDDAVSLTKEGNLYHLGVHIADVSNYVQGGSAIDREALKRGTSVYLADRVIPMLPERLSNGICSLNQGVERLVLSCLMDIDENGTVVSHKITESVIRVDRRMSYEQVRCILEDGETETSREYQEFVPMFFLMKELSGILRGCRHNRGSIDFDFPESKIILNGAGRAIDVKPYETSVATEIIEDFMLLANETVAREYCKGEYPFVYRTHENPDPDKVEELLMLLHNQGIDVRKSGQEITPKEIQEILESIQDLPNETMISRLTLRTMKQAKYTTECSGHFGLAARYYCHFTSPIRRYPDLQIHRIIRDNLRGRLTREGKTEHYREILEEVARQSSVCERRAQEAERESDKMKKAEYMSYHLGEEFDGIISGVTGYGLYVELGNTVEGLVHITALKDDYYTFDQETHELRGELTKKVYHLGQKIRVRVADADAVKRSVDFTIAEEQEE
ncbi:ribonuclease R [Blautia sp. CAG:257]|uniref:ribonuclease R n=1 Tax=Blautia sp. CAG:257 TaxID=1262756 RepID=UPI0003382AE8|nr:ribonuclease R [Blautia sp. CAG:257]CDA05886.1 ribonuclease R [Blautia sp. CAG:257]